MITKKINGGNFEPVVTGEIVLDAVPTEGSLNAVTSDGVAQAIAEGGGGSYTAGDGIAISEGEISAKVDGTTIQVNADGELEAIGGGGGGSYTAGDGIAIDNDEISAVLGNSSGGMQFDDDGIAIDWTYMENSSDGTLVAISDGGSNTSGIKVANPLPAPSAGDSGKVLKVGANGPEWGWQRDAEEPLYINNQGNVAIQLANTLYDNYGFLDIRNPLPTPTGATSGDVLTIGQNGPEWAAPGGGGGTSYTAGAGIYIDSNDEISIARDVSGGIKFNSSNEVLLDYTTIAEKSDGTLVESLDGNDVVGIQVANPVPDTTGASSGDVLTIGQSGPEWAAPAGGASYTAGDGINISDQNVISVPVDNKTLAVERPTYVYSGITIYTDTVYLALGLSDLPTVASTSGISAFKLTPQITGGGMSYTLRYDSETQAGLNVRVQLGSDSSFTKYATSTENAKIGNSPVVLGTTVFNLSDCNAFTPTMGHSSTTFGELFDFVGGDSFDDIFSGSSVYIRLVAWDSANGAVVGAPLTIRTTGYPNMRWAITTNAAAAKMVVKYNTNTLELSHPGNGYLSVKNPNPYPMPASLGIPGQVLTVNSGATGIKWASPSGIARITYGTSTYDDVINAYSNSNSVVICAKTNSSETLIGTFSKQYFRSNLGYVDFLCIEPVPMAEGSYAHDSLTVRTWTIAGDDTWSETTMDIVSSV